MPLPDPFSLQLFVTIRRFDVYHKIRRAPWRGCLVLILLYCSILPAHAEDSDVLADMPVLTPAQLLQSVLSRNPTLPAMRAAWKAGKPA